MGIESDRDVQFDALIGRIYDASLDERLWGGLAQDIAAAFNAPSAVLKIDRAALGGGQVDILQVTDNLVVSDQNRDWAEHWHQNDLWVQRSRAIGIDQIITSQDLLSDHELERTGYYQEWLRALGIHGMLGAVFSLGQDDVGVIGVHRPRGAGAFVHEDKRRLATFLPHVRRALQMRQRLQHASLAARASADVLARTGTATLVVDGQANVLYANELAEHLLRRDDAALQVFGGRLLARNPASATELRRLIERCVQTAAGQPSAPDGALTIQRPGQSPLTVLVAPLPPHAHDWGLSQPAALVFIRDAASLVPTPQTLRELFGLTRNEALIAAALAEGQTLEASAEALAMGLGTARTHLKSIMAKTGTHRQAQLVTLVWRSVAPLALRP